MRRLGVPALLAIAALAVGCTDEPSGASGNRLPEAFVTPSGVPVDVCALADLPIGTASERAASLRAAEAAWQAGNRFAEGVGQEQAKAATIFLAALQGDPLRPPNSAMASAGFLPLPEARDKLRAACE